MCKTVPTSGLLAFLFVATLAMACSMPYLAEQMDAAIEAARDLERADSGAAPAMQRSGGLPPGFYAKQCQWDACESPPERADPVSQPLR